MGNYKMAIEWELLQELARTYLDLQKTRVGMELRSQKMVDKELIKKGLAMYETVSEKKSNSSPTKIKNEEGIEEEIEGPPTIGKRIVKIKSDDEDEQKKIDENIEKETKYFKENSNTYKIIIAHKARLHKQEKDLLKDCVDLFRDSELWKWCLGVKGLGEVAGMTFIGYIDPTKTDNVNQLFSFLGMSAQRSKLKKGEQAHFNPKLKGRFLGVIGKNIIRSNDPYYASVYRIKKEYYKQRPDLLDKFDKKPKGWKGHIDKMAVRVLTKLITSHAYDILKHDRGLTERIIIDHRNNIPLKPESPIEQKQILETYQKNHAIFIEKLKFVWKDDETENKEKYFECLRHGGWGVLDR
jgi:hypothetical protein